MTTLQMVIGIVFWIGIGLLLDHTWVRVGCVLAILALVVVRLNTTLKEADAETEEMDE